MKKMAVALTIFCLLWLQGCGGNPVEETTIPASATNASMPSPQQAATPAPVSPAPGTVPSKTTEIIIDGRRADWSSYPEVGSDPRDDQVSDSPDLAELRAFNNNRYLYLLVGVYGWRMEGQYDILMDVNGGDFDYQVSVWPQENRAMFSVFPVSGSMQPIKEVTVIQAEAIEVKIPLLAVGDKPVKSIFVQTKTSAGERGDEMESRQIQTLAETEPAEVALTSNGPVAVGTLLDENLSLQVIYSGNPMVQTMRIGPDDKVYIAEFKGDTIYRLLEDGTVEEYLNFPGDHIAFFDFAPDGTLWVSRDGGLYHVRWGSSLLIATGVCPFFDFDSAGNLYALCRDNLVQRITPDGKVETIASGNFTTWAPPAVSPDGRVYFVNWNNELVRVEADGSLKVIARGFGVEDTPAFTPDRKLYVRGWFTGLRKVDPATGQFEQVTWVGRYAGLGTMLFFDARGYGYTYHPLLPLFRFDLETETVELIYHPHKNSIAMAIDPLTETPYVAYGNRLPNGETILFRVGKDKKLEEFGRVPFGIEHFITFAPDGTGYLSVGDMDKGSMIYIFKPSEGGLQEFVRPDAPAQAMAVEPGTGDLWATAGDQLVGYGANGGRRSIPFPEGANSSRFAFRPDGTLYAVVAFWSQAPNLPSPYKLYRYENNSWVQLKDMTPKDPAWSGTGLIALCPDGRLYLLQGSEDPQQGGPALFRLEDDNSLTIIGYGLGDFDTLASSCAPSGTYYFTNTHGIYSIPNLGAAP